SSTAGFWMKQVSHGKGNATAASGMPDQPWSWNYEFSGTKLEEFPLPSGYPISLASALDAMAQELTAASPESVVAKTAFTSSVLRESRENWHAIRSRMIALQEELDWQIYSTYGLHS